MTFSTVIIGEGALLIPCAEILLRQKHEIQAIVSANEAIQEWAREQNIRWVSRQDEVLSSMEERSFDFLFRIANLSVIPPRILAMPRRGAINCHDGPLPRYAGLHATTWAILNQETSHGVTWHEMQEAVDTGAIVHQSIFALAQDETAFTLNRKCFRAGIESFEEVVKGLGDATRRALPQSLSERTYFGKHTRPAAQACIDWTQPAEKIAALVRSLDFGPYANPLESPKVIGGGRVLLVPKLEGLPAFSARPPGTVLDVRGGFVPVATLTPAGLVSPVVTLSGGAGGIARAGVSLRHPLQTPPA